MGKKEGRREFKYLTSVETGMEFLDSISSYVENDKHVDGNGGYQISSLYYDTDSLRFYWDRTESVGHRRKVRLRSYGRDGRNEGLFLEIKERHKSAVIKKRSPVILSNNTGLPLLKDVIAGAEKESVRRETSYLDEFFQLHPTVVVTYYRHSRIGKYDQSLRVTLDTALTASNREFLNPESCDNWSFLDPKMAVLEVKADRSIGSWLQRELVRFGFSQVRYSKYCEALRALGMVSPINVRAASSACSAQSLALSAQEPQQAKI